jgi:alpha,alpha-trehalase
MVSISGPNLVVLFTDFSTIQAQAMNQLTIDAYIREGFRQTVHERRKDEGRYYGLPHPYLVPALGGGLDAYFYWDVYFANKGLLESGLQQQAIWNVENHLHQVERWGFVPNINQVHGTNRTQQPWLVFMVADILEHLEEPDAFLKQHWKTLVAEYAFWQERRQTPCGLNRNFHDADPEWLDNFYTYLKDNRFPGLDLPTPEARRSFASERLAECEIWDFTPRFFGRVSEFAPMDLNANLYGYETQLADWAEAFGTDDPATWRERARNRLERMNQLLWNEELGSFCDVDTVHARQSPVISAGMLNPLFFGVADARQAQRIRDLVVERLEFPHGISTCVGVDDGWTYQWDHPNGWPPVQLIAFDGLRRYGFDEDAARIAAKYITVVENNFASTGKLWEKYNVVSGGIDVSSEYALPEMFGWTAGVYLHFKNRV